MRIDVHGHYYPEAYREGYARLGGFPTMGGGPDGLAHRVAGLDESGTDRQILSAGALMPYFAEVSQSVTAARLFNRIYADAVGPVAARFGAFASLPLPFVDESLAELNYCLDELGFEGVALGSGAGGLPIDDALFDPLWEELNARGATVYLHPGVNNGSVLGGIEPEPWLLNPSFGSPGETGRCVGRLVLADIPRRFPRVSIVAANCGGTLPYAWPHLLRAADGTGREDFGEQLRTMWFDCGTITDYMLLAVSHSFGVDRLVFGSDAPYGSAIESATLIATSDLVSDAERRRILDVAPSFMERS